MLFESKTITYLLKFVKKEVKLRLYSSCIIHLLKDNINLKGYKMKRLKVLTIVAITGLVGMTALNACPKNCDSQKTCKGMKEKGAHLKDKRAHMKDVFRQLDLTSEQKTAMRENRKRMHEQRKAQREKRKGERGMSHMAQFVSAKGFDTQAFMDMASKRSQHKIQMHAKMFEEKINILTPAQRVKLVKLLQEKQQ